MNPDPHHETDDSLSWITILFPLVLAVLVSFVSPNYRSSTNNIEPDTVPTSTESRSGPLGGDFLQEYVGGWILHSENWEKLYDDDFAYSKQQQHDSQRLGFAWPEDQYFPMVYPPFYYWATGWLSRLGDVIGYSWVAKLWLWLNGLAITASVLLLNLFFPKCRSLLGIGVWSLIIYTPMLHNFNLGQKGGLLLLIVTATFLLLHHRKPFWGGLAFGLIAFKPHLGLVVGATMLLKGQWKFCAGALTMVGLLTGSSMLAFPGLWSSYVNVLGTMQDYVRTAGYELYDSHSLWGASELLLGGVSSSVANAVAMILSLVVVGLLLRSVWANTKLDSSTFQRQFAAMLLATVMLSPHFYSYDLTVTLLAIVLIAFALPSFSNLQTSATSTNSWQSSWMGKSLVYSLVGIFLVGAISSKVATVTKIQFSIPIMIFILWLLGSQLPVQNQSQDTEELADVAE